MAPLSITHCVYYVLLDREPYQTHIQAVEPWRSNLPDAPWLHGLVLGEDQVLLDGDGDYVACHGASRGMVVEAGVVDGGRVVEAGVVDGGRQHTKVSVR